MLLLHSKLQYKIQWSSLYLLKKEQRQRCKFCKTFFFLMKHMINDTEFLLQRSLE